MFCSHPCLPMDCHIDTASRNQCKVHYCISLDRSNEGVGDECHSITLTRAHSHHEMKIKSAPRFLVCLLVMHLNCISTVYGCNSCLSIGKSTCWSDCACGHFSIFCFLAP